MFAPASSWMAVAVFVSASRACSSVGVLEIEVERHETSLDVEVLDDHLPGRPERARACLDDLELRRGELLKLGEQVRVEAIARERDVRELERVCHAADAIVLLHEVVLGLDDGAVDVLRRLEPVADHLEDVRIGRQREDDHHHALRSRREHERVARVAEVLLQIAKEERLALLLQADQRVELRLRLGRRDRWRGSRRRRRAPPCRP